MNLEVTPERNCEQTPAFQINFKMEHVQAYIDYRK